MGFFSSGTQKSTTEQKMPAWQEAAVKQNLSDAMATGPVMFTDRNLTAANNPLLGQSVNSLQSLQPGLSGAQYGNYVRSGMNTLMDPNSYRPTFDQNAFNSVMNNTNLSHDMAALDSAYNQKLGDGLRQAGYGAGGFSGNFGSTGALAKSNAVGSAAADYAGSLANLYGGTRNAALGAGMNYGSQNATNTLNAANSLVGNAYSGLGLGANMAGQQFGMGQFMHGLDQAGIDREVNRDMFNAQAPMNNILFRQGVAGRMGDYGGTTITKTPTASPFQQALGAGIALGGAYLTGGGSLGGLGSMFGGGDRTFGSEFGVDLGYSDKDLLNWYQNG